MKCISTKSDFDQLIATANGLVCVDFFATWCGPCKVIAPQFVKWADQYPEVTFITIDVDENDETAEACGISAMPTFQFYKGGKKVGEVIGASESKILDLIKELK